MNKVTKLLRIIASSVKEQSAFSKIVFVLSIVSLIVSIIAVKL